MAIDSSGQETIKLTALKLAVVKEEVDKMDHFNMETHCHLVVKISED